MDMAITRETTRLFRLVPVLALAAAAALGGCNLETPAMPSYEKDVRPIFLSHCIRCHGAGGTLQGDPDDGSPGTCYLNTFADQGTCTVPADGSAPLATATCKPGARSCTLPIVAGSTVSWMSSVMIGNPNMPTVSMPPPPAPALTDWELDVVRRWIVNPLP
jgi:hypothetical protein